MKIDQDPMLSQKMGRIKKNYQKSDREDKTLPNHPLEQYTRALPLITTRPQITEKDRILAEKAEQDQRIAITMTQITTSIEVYEAKIRKWKQMIRVAEKSRLLEPKRTEDYDNLIKGIQPEILAAKEQISILKESLERLKKLT